MLSSHPNGVVVTVWVVPGASRDEVVGEHDGALKVRTAAPAEGGKANRRVSELIAQAVGGRRGDVVSGATSRHKRVVVSGVTLGEASVALGVGRRDT
jgi:uncharacterized protein (TIGR00251 family)